MVNNMKLKNSPNLKYCKLCSKHFTEECYEQELRSELLGIKKQVKLKNDAVPTLFDFSSYNMSIGKNLKKEKNKTTMSEKSKAGRMRIKQKEQKKFFKR